MSESILLKMLLSETANVGELTYAAEASRSLDALKLALKHPEPVVREGAIYGLENLAEYGDVVAFELIRQSSLDDFSPGVREAALDALEGIEYCV